MTENNEQHSQYLNQRINDSKYSANKIMNNFNESRTEFMINAASHPTSQRPNCTINDDESQINDDDHDDGASYKFTNGRNDQSFNQTANQSIRSIRPPQFEKIHAVPEEKRKTSNLTEWDSMTQDLKHIFKKKK